MRAVEVAPCQFEHDTHHQGVRRTRVCMQNSMGIKVGAELLLSGIEPVSSGIEPV